MGWTTESGLTPKKMKERIVREYTGNPNYTLIDIKATNYGRHIWTAIEDQQSGESFIFLTLMENRGQYGWSYKDLDESAGPFYFDCPIDLINKTTGVLSPIAIEWRQKVTESWMKSQRKWQAGEIVQIFNELYEIIAPYKKSYKVRHLKSGAQYIGRPKTFQEVSQSVGFTLEKE